MPCNSEIYYYLDFDYKFMIGNQFGLFKTKEGFLLNSTIMFSIFTNILYLFWLGYRSYPIIERSSIDIIFKVEDHLLCHLFRLIISHNFGISISTLSN